MTQISPDALDRKILAVLDTDARQSDAAIAKQVRASKQVVNYRIRRLEQAGVVSGYYAILNVGKLGYETYYIFTRLQGMTPEEEKALLHRIDILPFIGWSVTCTGSWDLVFSVHARSVKEFDDRLNEITELIGDRLHDYEHATLVAAEHISYRFLATDTDRIKQSFKSDYASLDSQDVSLLQVLSQDGRLSLTEYATRADLPVHVARHRLRKLRGIGILSGFKPKIDPSRLGLQWHLLALRFEAIPQQRRTQIMEYCRQHPLAYYVTHVVGTYNFMVDVHVSNALEYRDFLLELKEKFPDVIRSYDSVLVFEERKISYVPF